MSTTPKQPHPTPTVPPAKMPVGDGGQPRAAAFAALRARENESDPVEGDHEVINVMGNWTFRCPAWGMWWRYRLQETADFFLAAHLTYPVAPCAGATSAPAEEFPCPDDEHAAVDEDGFCRGCGEQT